MHVCMYVCIYVLMCVCVCVVFGFECRETMTFWRLNDYQNMTIIPIYI